MADEWSLALSGTVTPATSEVYLRALRQFLRYLDQHHPGVRSADDVTRQHVEGWMAALADKGLAPATRSVRLKSLSKFFDYVESETGHPNPCSKVARVRVEAPLVDVPTDATIRQLLAVCDGGKGFTDRRDAALIRLLADAGLRREEAVSLDLDDLDLPGRAVLVRKGKGGKPRMVAIGDKTALALSRWLRARKASPSSTGPALFLSTRGGRLTGGAVAMMLDRRCEDAGLPPIHRTSSATPPPMPCSLPASANRQSSTRWAGPGERWCAGTALRSPRNAPVT